MPQVFLGGLPSSITETDLRSFFSRYGEVVEVVIMYDQASNCHDEHEMTTSAKIKSSEKGSNTNFVIETAGEEEEPRVRLPLVRRGGGLRAGVRRALCQRAEQAGRDQAGRAENQHEQPVRASFD